MADEKSPKPSANPPSSAYEVGYKKPPKHTRWQPGQCGNPGGRGRGAKGLKTLVDQEIHSPVTITENGVKKTISKLEATLKRLSQKAINGEDRAINKLLDLAARAEDDDGAEAERSSSSPNRQAILDDYNRRMLANYGAAQATTVKDSDDGK